MFCSSSKSLEKGADDVNDAMRLCAELFIAEFDRYVVFRYDNGEGEIDGESKRAQDFFFRCDDECVGEAVKAMEKVHHMFSGSTAAISVQIRVFRAVM